MNKAYGYIEEKNGSKHLVFDSRNETNKVLKKYNEVWNGVKNVIKTIIGGKTSDYDIDFMKIKFNSDDNLPLNKILKLHNMIIIIRCVFQEGTILYTQIYLDECLYQL